MPKKHTAWLLFEKNMQIQTASQDESAHLCQMPCSKRQKETIKNGQCAKSEQIISESVKKLLTKHGNQDTMQQRRTRQEQKQTEVRNEVKNKSEQSAAP